MFGKATLYYLKTHDTKRGIVYAYYCRNCGQVFVFSGKDDPRYKKHEDDCPQRYVVQRKNDGSYDL